MNGRGIKRAATVPREARALEVSKADLLEVAWELAALTNDGDGLDDDAATYRRLVTALNDARSRRGGRKVVAFVPRAAGHGADRVEALAAWEARRGNAAPVVMVECPCCRGDACAMLGHLRSDYHAHGPCRCLDCGGLGRVPADRAPTSPDPGGRLPSSSSPDLQSES